MDRRNGRPVAAIKKLYPSCKFPSMYHYPRHSLIVSLQPSPKGGSSTRIHALTYALLFHTHPSLSHVVSRVSLCVPWTIKSSVGRSLQQPTTRGTIGLSPRRAPRRQPRAGNTDPDIGTHLPKQTQRLFLCGGKVRIVGAQDTRADIQEGLVCRLSSNPSGPFIFKWPFY